MRLKDMSSQDSHVKDLLNIGPKTASLLEEIDVYTEKDLKDLGPILTYKILKHRNKEINIIALYALYGALHHVHWNEIPSYIKEQLKADAQVPLTTDQTNKR